MKLTQESRSPPSSVQIVTKLTNVQCIVDKVSNYNLQPWGWTSTCLGSMVKTSVVQICAIIRIWIWIVAAYGCTHILKLCHFLISRVMGIPWMFFQPTTDSSVYPYVHNKLAIYKSIYICMLWVVQVRIWMFMLFISVRQNYSRWICICKIYY